MSLEKLPLKDKSYLTFEWYYIGRIYTDSGSASGLAGYIQIHHDRCGGKDRYHWELLTSMKGDKPNLIASGRYRDGEYCYDLNEAFQKGIQAAKDHFENRGVG